MVGVTERTVRHWREQGLLEPVVIGGSVRYRRADVEAFAAPSNE